MGGDWVGGQINAGDVLIFHSLTDTCSLPKRLRPASCFAGLQISRLSASFESRQSGFCRGVWKVLGKTYAGWRSNDLKYYWRKMPLTFKPSKAQLEQLAKTSESPSSRARYARILEQLDDPWVAPQQHRPASLSAGAHSEHWTPRTSEERFHASNSTSSGLRE